MKRLLSQGTTALALLALAVGALVVTPGVSRAQGLTYNSLQAGVTPVNPLTLTNQQFILASTGFNTSPTGLIGSGAAVPIGAAGTFQVGGSSLPGFNVVTPTSTAYSFVPGTAGVAVVATQLFPGGVAQNNALGWAQGGTNRYLQVSDAFGARPRITIPNAPTGTLQLTFRGVFAGGWDGNVGNSVVDHNGAAFLAHVNGLSWSTTGPNDPPFASGLALNTHVNRPGAAAGDPPNHYWDNSQGDFFRVTANGATIYSGTFHASGLSSQQTGDSVAGVTKVVGGTGAELNFGNSPSTSPSVPNFGAGDMNDNLYTFDITFGHGGGPLTIDFFGSGGFHGNLVSTLGNQIVGDQEFFGLDDIVLEVRGAPEPASIALFGFALAGLGGYTWRRRRMAKS